ncbi:MAG: hypothetical protein NEA02_00855 [Thermoanaerobaculia bacterium]|nr:hypothetical protein [Thermoanaerobaculia bacterium]
MRSTRGLIRFQIHAFHLGVVFSLALLLPSCNKNLGYIDLTGPTDPQWSMLRVSVENSGLSEISISRQGGTAMAAPAGQTIYPFIFYVSTSALPGSDWFDVQRQSVSLARVTFRPLRYPEKKGDLKDTRIIIGEPSPGRFSAVAFDPDWIEILSVTQPP